MVVQGGVQVGVTGAAQALLVGPARCGAEDFVTAAVGDAAELLGVDVDQCAGPGAFVAADGLAGVAVAGGQGGNAVPDEDALCGGSGDVASGGQPHWPGPVLAPQPDDLLFDDGRRLARAVMRAA